jgi:hypothetical protein
MTTNVGHPHWKPAHQSLENHRNVMRLAATTHGPGANDMDAEEIIRTSRRYGNHLGVEFGTTYRSAAVIGDGTRPPDVDDSYSDYSPSATPGCRAPHVWLGSPTAPVSTLDLFGAGFTVLTGPTGTVWHHTAQRAARTLKVPVASYAIGAPGLADSGQRFIDQYSIGRDGAVLIRPDGYVAWRRASGDPDGTAFLRAVQQVLHRHP